MMKDYSIFIIIKSKVLLYITKNTDLPDSGILFTYNTITFLVYSYVLNDIITLIVVCLLIYLNEFILSIKLYLLRSINVIPVLNISEWISVYRERLYGMNLFNQLLPIQIKF